MMATDISNSFKQKVLPTAASNPPIFLQKYLQHNIGKRSIYKDLFF